MLDPQDQITDMMSTPAEAEETVVSENPRWLFLKNPLFWLALAPGLFFLGFIIGVQLSSMK
jgi:hypothetical protein